MNNLQKKLRCDEIRWNEKGPRRHGTRMARQEIVAAKRRPCLQTVLVLLYRLFQFWTVGMIVHCIQGIQLARLMPHVPGGVSHCHAARTGLQFSEAWETVGSGDTVWRQSGWSVLSNQWIGGWLEALGHHVKATLLVFSPVCSPGHLAIMRLLCFWFVS